MFKALYKHTKPGANIINKFLCSVAWYTKLSECALIG